MTTPLHVLFLCTHNSARSIMFASALNALDAGRFEAHSAGSQPAGTVNPYALAELERRGLPTDDARSKSWDEFSAPGAPGFDPDPTFRRIRAGDPPAPAPWKGH